MKLDRFRYLIALLAALVLFQNVMASVRVCTMPLAVRSHIDLPMIEVDGHGNADPCSESSSEPACLSHFSPVSIGDPQVVFSGATATAVRSYQALYCVAFPSVPARLDIATSSSCAPPSPILLFGNLRV